VAPSFLQTAPAQLEIATSEPTVCDEPRAAGFVHSTAIIDEDVELGAGTKVWHYSHISRGACIGPDNVLGQNVFVAEGVRTGAGCKVQNNVSLYKGVELEDGVFCGPSCVFTNVVDPRAFIEKKAEFRPTLVKQGASIGANATIVCGHTLGRYCLVGSGAVVTRDVPDYALVTGVPARQRGWVCRCGARLAFAAGGEHMAATCGRCGGLYDLSGGVVRPVRQEAAGGERREAGVQRPEARTV
jgi:UDP-2-acetamido-3-amino-2,3-dideoxy-glucuronate N-acetyltransferase